MNETPSEPEKPAPRLARGRLAVIVAYLIAGAVYWRQLRSQAPPTVPDWMAVGLLLIPLVVLLWPWRVPNWLRADVGDGRWRRLRRALGPLPWATAVSGWQVVLVSLSALLMGLVLLWIPRLDAQMAASYGWLFWGWLLAIGIFAGAVWPWAQLDWRAWRRRWSGVNRPVWYTLAVILLLAAGLRLWQLDTIPFTLAGDEGAQGLEAVKVLQGEIRNPFSTGWLGVPTMSFFYNSLTIRWLGRTILALRLPWTLLGIATVPVAFLLGRQLKGVRYGLLTAGLLAVYHYHIHFSRLGSNQIADPLFAGLALFFLQRSIDGNRRWDWFLTGAIAGLAFYFYAGARLTPVLVVLVLAYHLLYGRRQFWQPHWPGMILATATFLLVGAPMFQYAARFPNEFNARINQVGIIQSGWLQREVVITGHSAAAILWDQFRRAVLLFNYYPDRTVWYGLREPLLDPWFGSLFLLGLGLVTVRTLWGRTGDRRLAPVTIWWWSGVILGGMLTESPPSSQRLITLALPTCFILATALWELVDLTVLAWPRLTGRWLATGLGLIFALGSIWLYFVDFTPERIYGGLRRRSPWR